MKDFLLNLVLGTLTAPLRAWPQQRINGFLVRFGKAFGPPGLRHFSELSLAEQQELLARVPVLRTNHSDFLRPFQWIQRTTTVWLGPAPTEASILMVSEGNPDPLKPIPQPGHFVVLKGYMAATTAEGIHDRLGFRWDDSDLFYELSFSVKLR